MRIEMKSDKDKMRRLQGVTHMIEQGTLFVNRRMTKLIDEMRYFPATRHDDLLDALVYALTIIKMNPYAQRTETRLPEQKYSQFTAYFLLLMSIISLCKFY